MYCPLQLNFEFCAHCDIRGPHSHFLESFAKFVENYMNYDDNTKLNGKKLHLVSQKKFMRVHCSFSSYNQGGGGVSYTDFKNLEDFAEQY